MVEIGYIKPQEFSFCSECDKLMGNCEHTNSSTYKIQWLTKAEILAKLGTYKKKG